MLPVSDVNAGPTRVTQILFDPVDDGTVWATVEVGGIYRSKDRGASWEYKDKGLVSGDVHGLAVLKLPGGGKALLATTNRGLHRSEDNGETWALQELPSPWPYTRSVVPRADGAGVVFLTNGNGPPGNDGFLLRSRDHGRTWQDAKLPGPLESTVWCVATNAADPMLIFVCTNLGELFRSTDGGERWTRLPHLFGELRALHWRALARRHAARCAFGDAAGAEGRAAGLGGGMSAGQSPLKVGLMVPANNTTMEVELPAWLPAGSSVTTVKIPRGPGLLTQGDDAGLSRQRDRARAPAFRRRRARSHRLWLHRGRLHLRPGRRRRALRQADRGDRAAGGHHRARHGARAAARRSQAHRRGHALP